MGHICYVSITTEEATLPYLALVRKVFQKVSRPDTEITIKSVEPGLNRAFDPRYAYFAFLNKREIIEKVIEADKEGYDAAIVGCFLDPGVREAREIVNMPVMGLAEPTLLLACLLGYKFGIVTIKEPKLIPEMEIGLKLYGLEHRAIANPIRMISTPSIEVFTKGMEEPGFVASDVLERSQSCVADGAEVVVIGCNGLGPLCTLSNIVKVEEGDVPILDCVSVAIKMAETIIELNNRLGVPFISRARMYASPKEKDMKRVRALFGLKAD